MGTEIFLRRKGEGLIPMDLMSRNYIEKLDAQTVIRAVVTKPRNYDHHKKYFALLHAVYEHQDTYPSFNSFRSAVAVALGHSESVKLPDGRTILVPGSIAFGKMDQSEFEEFYEKAVDLVLTRIVPGVNREDLERRVLDILKGRDL